MIARRSKSELILSFLTEKLRALPILNRLKIKPITSVHSKYLHSKSKRTKCDYSKNDWFAFSSLSVPISEIPKEICRDTARQNSALKLPRELLGRIMCYLIFSVAIREAVGRKSYTLPEQGRIISSCYAQMRII